MFFFIKKNGDSLVAAVIGFMIIWLFTRHSGIGISPDSVVYSSAAESFVQHGSILAYGNEPLIDFPAFYPVFLGSLRFLSGHSPVLIGPWLNAVLFSLLIFIAGKMMQEFEIRSRIYRIAILSCILLSPALLEVYSMLWSETVFAIFLLLFMVSLRRYFLNYGIIYLLLAAAIAALASVTRYAGITFIGAGAAFIFVDSRLLLRKKFKHLSVFMILSGSLLVLTLIRNYLLSETTTGYREASRTGWMENLKDTGAVFSDWLPFVYNQAHLFLAIGLVILLSIALSVALHYWKIRRISNFESMAAGFSLIYILFMITIASISRFETLDSRFFSPVFIPILWTASYWIPGKLKSLQMPLKAAVGALAFFLLVAFQSRQVQTDLDTWEGVKDAGIPGYTEDEWTQSPMVKYLQSDSLTDKKGYIIYSDAYDAVYFFTGRQGRFLPHKEMKDEMEEFMAEPRFYIVWFNDGQNPDLIGLDFIRKIRGMKLLRHFEDGEIYEYGQ